MCLDFHVRAREDIDLKTIPNLFISNDVILIRYFFVEFLWFWRKKLNHKINILDLYNDFST